jgi:hypothetical protein
MTSQTGASSEMVFLSQAPNTDISSYNGRYWYDNTAGQGVDVYLVDFGADRTHQVPDAIPLFLSIILTLPKQEFTQGANVARNMRYIFADRTDKVKGDARTGHGTCMLSKITGHQYGTSKRVNPIIVKVPLNRGPQYFLEGVSKVLNVINTPVAQGGKGGNGANTVLNLSWYYETAQLQGQTGWAIRLYMLLRLLHDKGVVIVAGSGNGNKNSITGFPAIFGGSSSPATPLANMIVVGGVNVDDYTRFGNYDVAAGLPHVFGPAGGSDMRCANARESRAANGLGQYKATSGTSVGK